MALPSLELVKATGVQGDAYASQMYRQAFEILTIELHLPECRSANP